MSEQTHVSKLYSFLPTEVDGFNSLAELALDLRWSWCQLCREEVDNIDFKKVA